MKDLFSANEAIRAMGGKKHKVIDRHHYTIGWLQVLYDFEQSIKNYESDIKKLIPILR